VTQFDWESVGSVLLERERRPVIVLDLQGLVVRTNGALLLFLEEGVRTHRVNFAEEWLLPESRPTFFQAWTRVLEGERLRVSVALRPTVFHLEPVFDLVPLTREGAVGSVMLLMVDAGASVHSMPLMPAHGMLYEVSTDGDGRPERLLRALTSKRLPRLDTSLPCYRALLGRETACADCPVRISKEPGSTATTVRLESNAPFTAQLISARKVRDDLASVNVLPLDQGTYSALVQARIEALGTRGKLSGRERQVLALMLMGRNLEDVAELERITARTAKYHLQNLLRKLGAESRTDLFRLLT